VQRVSGPSLENAGSGIDEDDEDDGDNVGNDENDDNGAEQQVSPLNTLLTAAAEFASGSEINPFKAAAELASTTTINRLASAGSDRGERPPETDDDDEHASCVSPSSVPVASGQYVEYDEEYGSSVDPSVTRSSRDVRGDVRSGDDDSSDFEDVLTSDGDDDDGVARMAAGVGVTASRSTGGFFLLFYTSAH
jgi:hypothetical protein